MHGRIYEISRTPMSKPEMLNSLSVPDSFYSVVAEYTSNDVCRENDIENLIYELRDLIIAGDDGSILFKEGYKQLYFKLKYNQFVRTLKQLSEVSLDTFSGCAVEYYPLGRKMEELNELYNEQFNTYIYFEGELMTLDNWIRYSHFNEDDRWYFGGTVDYHR